MRQNRFTHASWPPTRPGAGEAALGAMRDACWWTKTYFRTGPVRREAEWPAVKHRGVAAGQHPVGPPFRNNGPLGDPVPRGGRSMSSIKIAVLPPIITDHGQALRPVCDGASFVDDRPVAPSCMRLAKAGLWRRAPNIRGATTTSATDCNGRRSNNNQHRVMP